METWRDLGSRRVYLTHWPVKEADIESVTTNGTDRLDYELEEALRASCRSSPTGTSRSSSLYRRLSLPG